MGTEYRVGSGWDSHVFVPGRRLWLGGIEIDHPLGLAGHSDGDVLLHAICDAMLGAMGEGDIGTYFAGSDARWLDARSELFVRHAAQMAHRAGWHVVNLDANLILEQPRIQPLREALRESVGSLLEIPSERVSIKGKTPEGMGGANTAIAQAVVLLRREQA
ncbi:MAG: 2-C-methyl-D-erythritol 2,4-cyclodiphosphate synthase [Terriglobales bacterium]